MHLYRDIQDLIEKIALTAKEPGSASGVIGDVLEGKPVDALPYIVRCPWGAVAPGTRYNLKEQFYDPEKMLHAHLEEILRTCQSAHGAPLMLRPNFGTIFVPAAFGAGYDVLPDAYPWVTGHFSQEDIPRLEEADLLGSEMMQRALEYIRYFRSMLPEWIHVYQPDTQGPFDIAHLLLGNDIFYLLLDDPDEAHRLMRIATDGYCRITRALKEALSEPEGEMYHGHALARGIYMRNGGTRVSEDTPTLLSPEMIDEFVLPYDEQALAQFGGGFIHFCGRHEYLLEKFAGMKGCRALNLGNPEMYDFDWVMRVIRENGCVYFGHWPRREGEDANAYIERMYAASLGGKRHLLLHVNEDLFPGTSEEDFFSLWHRRAAAR